MTIMFFFQDFQNLIYLSEMQQKIEKKLVSSLIDSQCVNN